MSDIARETPKIYGDKDAEPPPDELTKLLQKWKDEGKPSKIAASFTKIEDVQPIHIEHFKEYNYLWKPLQGGIWGGIWVTDNIPYVHIVLATTPVVEFLLNLKKDNASNPNRGRISLTETSTREGPEYVCKTD